MTVSGNAAGSTISSTKAGPSSPGRTSFPFPARPLRNMVRGQPTLLHHIADPRPRQQTLSHDQFTISLGSMAFHRSFTSSGQRRRPVGPSITLIRATPVRLGTAIRCSFWRSTAILPKTSFAGRYARIAIKPKSRAGRSACGDTVLTLGYFPQNLSRPLDLRQMERQTGTRRNQLFHLTF